MDIPATPEQEKTGEKNFINLERLKSDLLELAKIGYDEETKGVHRLGFSDEDMEARAWLIEKLKEIGADAKLDEAGNVIGRFKGKNDSLPSVVIGSHIDSVPAGGIFDGTLGVLTGLECMRTLKDIGHTPERPVEIIAFADEEGRFGGMFGVQAYTGKVTPEWLQSARSVTGLYLKDAMKRHGLDAMRALSAARKPDSVHAFLELHIEQGPILEAEEKTIGIVEGISGVFKWVIRLIGKANHAGTAPMHLRSDAFMGLADFAHEIPRIIDEEGTDKSRLTVGKVELKPGSPHTVPGEVEFSLVGRDMDAEVMKTLANTCHKALSAIARRHNLRFEYDELSWLDPQYCSEEVLSVFEKHAKALNINHIRMPSGAGHDTQFMAEFTKAGMIFVPSVGGISHAPDEYTSWHDIEKGANLFYLTLLDFLEEATHGKK